jgi:hypothetical protein
MLTVHTVVIWEQRRCITCVIYGLYTVAMVFALLLSLLLLKRTACKNEHSEIRGRGRSIDLFYVFRSKTNWNWQFNWMFPDVPKLTSCHYFHCSYSFRYWLVHPPNVNHFTLPNSVT